MDARTALQIRRMLGRAVVRAVTRARDPWPAWLKLVSLDDATTAREYVRWAAPDLPRYLATMDGLGIPSDADLCCASCRVVLDHPSLYAEPHDRPDGTPCRYVRVYDTHFLESDVCDGDIPRDDVRENVTKCEGDDDGTPVEQAARHLIDEGITEPSSWPDWHPDLWWSDPNGSREVDEETAERSERTAHLYGFTHAEQHEVWELVRKG